MRIAMVSEHANPLAAFGGNDADGQSVYVAALATSLVCRGHEVVVYTRRDNPGAPPHVATPAGYEVEHVPAGPPAEVPRDELFPHMGEFARYLARGWAVRPFDVVHSHFWMSGLAAISAAARNGLPVVHTFHELGSVERRYQGRRDRVPQERLRIEAEVAKGADRVVAGCVDEVRELLAIGMDRLRATVVPCGVDVDLFRPSGPLGPVHSAEDAAPRLPERSMPYRLLCVGRLVEGNGIDDVVMACASCPTRSWWSSTGRSPRPCSGTPRCSGCGRWPRLWASTTVCGSPALWVAKRCR